MMQLILIMPVAIRHGRLQPPPGSFLVMPYYTWRLFCKDNSTVNDEPRPIALSILTEAPISLARLIILLRPTPAEEEDVVCFSTTLNPTPSSRISNLNLCSLGLSIFTSTNFAF